MSRPDCASECSRWQRLIAWSSSCASGCSRISKRYFQRWLRRPTPRRLTRRQVIAVNQQRQWSWTQWLKKRKSDMGLSAALGIGQTALAAYQAALQVVGQNIANAATPGYTRTSADLIAVPGVGLRGGQLGNGVFLSGVRRNISESLQARLRFASSDVQSADAQRSGLDRIEGIFDPLGDSNLGAQ